MKKILITLLLMIAGMTNAQQWTLVSQIPTGPHINSISVVNQNVIWICCDTAKLYLTVNGGLNWTLRNNGLPVYNLYGISALDSMNCWVGTRIGSIYRTSDGGLNWSVQFSLSGSFSNCIKMFDMNYGIYNGDPTGAGQPMQYRYTTNGGSNWNLSPNAPISSNHYSLVNAWDWLDTGHIWIGVANAVTNATNTKVNRTFSGFQGGVWDSYTFLGTGTSDGLYAQAIAFTDLQNGMLGINNSAIRKTTNGGINWNTVSAPGGLISFYVTEMESFKDASHLIRAGIGTTATHYIYRTTDYGTTWVNEPLPALGSVNKLGQMEFVNQSLGYAGCASGVFMKFTGPSGINSNANTLPGEFKLEQNFPNPFNPSTTINFSIPATGQVLLKIYDVTGREVNTLLNEIMSAGNYSVDFNAPDGMNSGVYFYTLVSGNNKESKRFILTK